jgi:hypothetical protein
MGVNAFIAQAAAEHEAKLLTKTLSSPLFPGDFPWSSVSAVPEKPAQRLQHQLSAISAAVANYRADLTSKAGELATWLDASDDDVRELALNFARLDLSGTPDLSGIPQLEKLPNVPCAGEFPGLFQLLTRPGLPESPALKKLLWAQELLGAAVPGKCLATQLARLSDARFWRRAIRVRLLREREHFFLRLRLVGTSAEAYVSDVSESAELYVSDVQLVSRLSQLKRQALWMKETVLVPRYLEPGEVVSIVRTATLVEEVAPAQALSPEEAEKAAEAKKAAEEALELADYKDWGCVDETPGGLLTLEQVASTPRTRFAKLYAFVKAMDAIAIEQGLASGMLTLTLEPEWHPNPSNGANSWNDASPREAHQSMALRWQSILRDLDRMGVGVSGLRVVEPHKDACPHWHLWLLYQPAAEQSILETVMRYFPNKLKLRNPSAKRSKSDAKSAATLSMPASAGDVIFDSLAALQAHAGRAPTSAKEGAQVELSRIDRRISSGASYAMKYMLKTVDAGDVINTEAGLFPELGAGATPKQNQAQAERRAKHLAAAKRVDAYRSLWGINAGQLFGVAKCLTAWDELRRLAEAPKHPLLNKLWALARGSKKEGSIGAGDAVRGDAKGFIEALGGLAACGKAPKGLARVSIGRLTEAALNGYGETIDRTKGVTLVQRTRERVVTGSCTNKKTGEVKLVTAWRSVTTVLTSIKTRLHDWTLVRTLKLSKADIAAGKVDARLQAAIALAEQRMLADIHQDSPAHLSTLAVRAFWSNLWDALASAPSGPGTAASPPCTLAPA